MMLLSVGGPENAEDWVRNALAEKQKIMGFGHRVYKDVDPRAEIVKEFCRRVADARGDTSLEQSARIIEDIVAPVFTGCIWGRSCPGVDCPRDVRRYWSRWCTGGA